MSSNMWPIKTRREANPCKKCTKHGEDIYCHSTCKDFLKWKEEDSNLKAEINKNKHVDNIVRDAQIMSARRKDKNGSSKH